MRGVCVCVCVCVCARALCLTSNTMSLASRMFWKPVLLPSSIRTCRYIDTYHMRTVHERAVNVYYSLVNQLICFAW